MLHYYADIGKNGIILKAVINHYFIITIYIIFKFAVRFAKKFNEVIFSAIKRYL